MEKSNLCPDLQNIVDGFASFRITHYAAQEEVIRLQKIESSKMDSRLENVTAAFIDYQKRSNAVIQNLESENRTLQRILDNFREQENANMLQIQRDNVQHMRELENDLEELRSKFESEMKKHEEQINSMEKSHEEEINLYKKELECLKTTVEKEKDKSSVDKKKIEENNNTLQESLPLSNKRSTYTHPAFDDSTKCKRKKSALPAFRWPPLDFSVKKAVGANLKAVPEAKKKKKLYQADNDAIVDLTILHE